MFANSVPVDVGTGAIGFIYQDWNAYRNSHPEPWTSLDEHDLIAELLENVQVNASVQLVAFGAPQLSALIRKAAIREGFFEHTVPTQSGGIARVQVFVAYDAAHDEPGIRSLMISTKT